MTAMCLKRAGLFHERGIPSAVVTFDAIPELGALRSSLVEAGRLNPDVPLLNLHDFYAGNSPARTDRQVPSRPRAAEWVEGARTHRSDDGSLFHVDYRMPGRDTGALREYHRIDGTVYLVDSTTPAEDAAQESSRTLQLVDPDGYVTATFTSAAKLYRRFLTELVDLAHADVVVDSKYSAGFLWSWKHPEAVKIVNFHSTHVSPGKDALTGKLSATHQKIIQNRDAWDGITFLTESQRTAFVQRFGETSNTFVISNPVDGPRTLPAFGDRKPNSVIHVGRFTKGKNIGELLEIAKKVATAGVPIHLDLVGDGDQRPELEAKVRQLGAEDLITFHGHVNDVGQRLHRARVLLLCSKFEGQSLAILEAQAHGCVPVAYDVDFGPRDVIENRRNGFLVPFGEQETAVQAVTSLLTDDSLCEAMSTQGFNDSVHFRSDVIFGKWMEALDTARANRAGRDALTAANVRIAGIRFHPDGDMDLEVYVEIGEANLSRLCLQSRQRGIPDGNGIEIQPHHGDDSVFHFRLPADLRAQQPAGDALDLNLVLGIGSMTRTIRLGASPSMQTTPYFTVYGNLSLK
ncbi:glycosyltransferase [Paeniglutamicibacter sulfureus]|uniref:Poly(Glycerol-phosphate) alpha-glucosyltransferase n=1 Tax=Paeniglutamicibacter sulfureus TaxID=43666 RepID=A0ABU2BP78_9MICC|nr:glycosyltransferase [Paeniglutamicibacter sulfureus]MDR7360435.1 poly(glycerol-phosphate) alpha-glucosyltransferase [Paeniglutamicibacter sulfureus]